MSVSDYDDVMIEDEDDEMIIGDEDEDDHFLAEPTSIDDVPLLLNLNHKPFFPASNHAI